MFVVLSFHPAIFNRRADDPGTRVLELEKGMNLFCRKLRCQHSNGLRRGKEMRMIPAGAVEDIPSYSLKGRVRIPDLGTPLGFFQKFLLGFLLQFL